MCARTSLAVPSSRRPPGPCSTAWYRGSPGPAALCTATERTGGGHFPGRAARTPGPAVRRLLEAGTRIPTDRLASVPCDVGLPVRCHAPVPLPVSGPNGRAAQESAGRATENSADCGSRAFVTPPCQPAAGDWGAGSGNMSSSSFSAPLLAERAAVRRTPTRRRARLPGPPAFCGTTRTVVASRCRRTSLPEPVRPRRRFGTPCLPGQPMGMPRQSN